jgi:predicted ABC-type transport system involved in lysophospholipase L1 biosynthesis ATPase subunit
VIIATENAMMSKWVNYEVGMAEALGKQIVVVGKRGSDKSSLPMYLKRLGDVQAVELEAEGMDLD